MKIVLLEPLGISQESLDKLAEFEVHLSCLCRD